jgi:hypothetical protein
MGLLTTSGASARVWLHEQGALMKDQHEKISGYRDLSEGEIFLINELKAHAKEVLKSADWLRRDPDGFGFDQRAVSIAITNLETGFMWLTKAVARPTQ